MRATVDWRPEGSTTHGIARLHAAAEHAAAKPRKVVVRAVDPLHRHAQRAVAGAAVDLDLLQVLRAGSGPWYHGSVGARLRRCCRRAGPTAGSPRP
jgi:hypothetical protein